MKNIFYYGLTLILAIIIFAILSAPVFLLRTPLESYKNLVTIEQLEGRIINGSAKIIKPNISFLSKIKLPIFKDNFLIDQIDWQFDLLALFNLKLKFYTKIYFDHTRVKADIIGQIDGLLRIENLKTALQLVDILPLIKQLPSISGSFFIHADYIALKDNKLIDIVANVNITNFILFEQNIGQLIADISYDKTKEKILIKLSSKQAKIDIKGVIGVDKEGNYQISIKLTPNRGIGQDLTDMLSLVGYQSGNSRIFKQNGKIQW